MIQILETQCPYCGNKNSTIYDNEKDGAFKSFLETCDGEDEGCEQQYVVRIERHIEYTQEIKEVNGERERYEQNKALGKLANQDGLNITCPHCSEQHELSLDYVGYNSQTRTDAYICPACKKGIDNIQLRSAVNQAKHLARKNWEIRTAREQE